MNTSSLGFSTETFDELAAAAPANNGAGFGNFYSAALDATFSAPFMGPPSPAIVILQTI